MRRHEWRLLAGVGMLGLGMASTNLLLTALCLLLGLAVGWADLAYRRSAVRSRLRGLRRLVYARWWVWRSERMRRGRA